MKAWTRGGETNSRSSQINSPSGQSKNRREGKQPPELKDRSSGDSVHATHERAEIGCMPAVRSGAWIRQGNTALGRSGQGLGCMPCRTTRANSSVSAMRPPFYSDVRAGYVPNTTGHGYHGLRAKHKRPQGGVSYTGRAHLMTSTCPHR